MFFNCLPSFISLLIVLLLCCSFYGNSQSVFHVDVSIRRKHHCDFAECKTSFLSCHIYSSRPLDNIEEVNIVAQIEYLKPIRHWRERESECPTKARKWLRSEKKWKILHRKCFKLKLSNSHTSRTLHASRCQWLDRSKIFSHQMQTKRIHTLTLLVKKAEACQSNECEWISETKHDVGIHIQSACLASQSTTIRQTFILSLLL